MTSPVILGPEDIQALWNPAELLREIEECCRKGRRRRAHTPERSIIQSAEGDAAFVSMPCYSEDGALFTVKSAVVFTGAVRSGASTVNASVTALCARTGRVVALLDGNAITKLKCAGVTSYVTRECTANESHVLSVLGAGVQARQQIIGVSQVRELSEIRIWARRESAAAELANEVNAAVGGIARSYASIEEAVEGASIVSTATSSNMALSPFPRLRSHVHINCMGAHSVTSREVPRAILEASTIVVEDRETAIREAGAVHERALEIEELTPDLGLSTRSTVFSSTGHAFFDWVTTRHVLRNASVVRRELRDLQGRF